MFKVSEVDTELEDSATSVGQEVKCPMSLLNAYNEKSPSKWFLRDIWYCFAGHSLELTMQPFFPYLIYATFLTLTVWSNIGVSEGFNIVFSGNIAITVWAHLNATTVLKLQLNHKRFLMASNTSSSPSNKTTWTHTMS